MSLDDLYRLHNKSIEVGEFNTIIGGTILEFDPGELTLKPKPEYVKET